MMRADPTGEYVIVDTSAGPVRGFWRTHSAAFLGIPYAEPPFDENRFGAPVPRVPWTGVRDARVYAPTPQRQALAEITTIPEPSIPGPDVLNLNVFTPQPSPDAEPLPVMVYIHGGGYVAGSPASPWYDGAAFNRDGVVTVSIAYRLGFEGFGCLPDAADNRGLLDCLLALEWVRDNIAAFGGNPNQVTIVGQSAGGGMVMTLLTMPRARGLFIGAASISGVPSDIPLDRAQQTAVELADRLGVTADSAGFASVSETELITAQGGGFQSIEKPTADDLLAIMRALDGRLRLGPVVDGDLHPWTVEEGLRSGAGRDVGLLVGATRQEFGGLAHANSHLFDEHDVAELLQQVGLDSAAARRLADAMPDEHPADVVGQYISDLVFRRRVVDWLELRRDVAPTWGYDFAWRSAVSGVAEHCLDVPFVFDLLEDPDVTRVAGPNAPQALATQVHGGYVSFIRDGNPAWPAYHDSRSVMVFDADSAVVSGGYESVRALTDEGKGVG